MGFMTTVLAALRFRAGHVTVKTEPALVYRADVDARTFLRAQVNTVVTHRARVDSKTTHRAQLEAR